MNPKNDMKRTTPTSPSVQPAGRIIVEWPTQIWLAFFSLLATLFMLVAHSCVEREPAREVPHVRVVERLSGTGGRVLAEGQQAPHEPIHPVAALPVTRPPGVGLDALLLEQPKPPRVPDV